MSSETCTKIKYCHTEQSRLSDCSDGQMAAELFFLGQPKGVTIMEQSNRWPEGVLLGEVRTQIVNGEFLDEIVPIVERSEAELLRRRQQTEEHKAYRAELYKRYSLEERLEDLTS